MVTTTRLPARGKHVEHGVLIENCYIEGYAVHSRRVHLISLEQRLIIGDV